MAEAKKPAVMPTEVPVIPPATTELTVQKPSVARPLQSVNPVPPSTSDSERELADALARVLGNRVKGAMDADAVEAILEKGLAKAQQQYH